MFKADAAYAFRLHDLCFSCARKCHAATYQKQKQEKLEKLEHT